MKGIIYFVLLCIFATSIDIFILQGMWKYAFICYLLAVLFLVLLAIHLKIKV